MIFIRLDLGLVTDNTGLAIAYFDGWKTYDKDDKVRQPIIKVPLAVGISREDGQETSIDHIQEFIFDLNSRFEIGCFTCDQFQSRMLLQSLTHAKIPNQYLSVDRTDEAYVYMKLLAQRGLLHLPNNKLLQREGIQLRRVGNKIDHPNDGSKDICDAVSGAVFNLYQKLDIATQISKKYKAHTIAEQYQVRTKTETSMFQDQLKGLF